MNVVPGTLDVLFVVAAGHHVGEGGAGDVGEVGDAGVLPGVEDLLRLRHYVTTTTGRHILNYKASKLEMFLKE
jgi:hypothetical protein